MEDKIRVTEERVDSVASEAYAAQRLLRKPEQSQDELQHIHDTIGDCRYLLHRLWAQYERENEAAIMGAMAMMEKIDAFKLPDGWIRVEMLESEYDRMREELGGKYEFQGVVKLTVNGKP